MVDIAPESHHATHLARARCVAFGKCRHPQSEVCALRFLLGLITSSGPATSTDSWGRNSGWSSAPDLFTKCLTQFDQLVDLICSRSTTLLLRCCIQSLFGRKASHAQESIPSQPIGGASRDRAWITGHSDTTLWKSCRPLGSRPCRLGRMERDRPSHGRDDRGKNAICRACQSTHSLHWDRSFPCGRTSRCTGC